MILNDHHQWVAKVSSILTDPKKKSASYTISILENKDGDWDYFDKKNFHDSENNISQFNKIFSKMYDEFADAYNDGDEYAFRLSDDVDYYEYKDNMLVDLELGQEDLLPVLDSEHCQFWFYPSTDYNSVHKIAEENGKFVFKIDNVAQAVYLGLKGDKIIVTKTCNWSLGKPGSWFDANKNVDQARENVKNACAILTQKLNELKNKHYVNTDISFV